mmetsp:Transcript_76527/g.232002  ORF Transcript_76527/g.232002 Transcript_76527/m.232002 type:complete len:202 (-) Transcript_76527:43-648(-)
MRSRMAARGCSIWQSTSAWKRSGETACCREVARPPMEFATDLNMSAMSRLVAYSTSAAGSVRTAAGTWPCGGSAGGSTTSTESAQQTRLAAGGTNGGKFLSYSVSVAEEREGPSCSRSSGEGFRTSSLRFSSAATWSSSSARSAHRKRFAPLGVKESGGPEAKGARGPPEAQAAGPTPSGTETSRTAVSAQRRHVPGGRGQ